MAGSDTHELNNCGENHYRAQKAFCNAWDNGTQFTSQEFTEFLKLDGIQHYKSAPYHPTINGEAERYVQTFKQAMRADPGTLSTKLMRFLLAYQTTPNATTGISPAALLFGRTLRNLLKSDGTR